jgi:hypothetical protein
MRISGFIITSLLVCLVSLPDAMAQTCHPAALAQNSSGLAKSPTISPTIEITRVPPAGEGMNSHGQIAGRTNGSDFARQCVVIYACTNTWFVQPYTANPFTTLKPDGSFQTDIHLGYEYAALLVDQTFVPPPTLDNLPGIGQGVLAIDRAPAAGPSNCRCGQPECRQ